MVDRSKHFRVELYLEEKCRKSICDFFLHKYTCPPASVVEKLHLTVYFASMRVPNARLGTRKVAIEVPVSETRFMLMEAGGEEAKPHLKANKSKVGIRIRQRSGELYGIQALRGEYCKLETKEMLGKRKKSNNKFNAFGFLRFQPHITFLRPGNRLNPDLYPLGADFRGTFKSLRFDRLVSREVDPVKTNGNRSINSKNKPDELGDSWSELNKIKLD
jgi:hypothetical protein